MRLGGTLTYRQLFSHHVPAAFFVFSVVLTLHQRRVSGFGTLQRCRARFLQNNDVSQSEWLID